MNQAVVLDDGFVAQDAPDLPGSLEPVGFLLMR
jgi:hypothetical protein